MPAKPKVKKNPSAEKRMRQAEKRNLRNKATKSKIKTYMKKFEQAIESKNKDAVSSALSGAIKVISTAKSKGIIKDNTASRNISRFTKKANSALKPEAV